MLGTIFIGDLILIEILSLMGRMKKLNLHNLIISLIILTQVGIQEVSNLNPQQPRSIGGRSHKVNEVLI